MFGGHFYDFSGMFGGVFGECLGGCLGDVWDIFLIKSYHRFLRDDLAPKKG